MESALALWRARERDGWLVGVEAATWRARVQACQAAFVRRAAGVPWEITTTDPRAFVTEFLAAITYWERITVVLGKAPAGMAEPPDERGSRVLIATGGTSGAPRFAAHTWSTLATAALGLQQKFGGGPIDGVCFLPLTHVSGLMQLVRSFVSGGRLTLADWHEIEAGRFPAVTEGAVTSLVPTQLTRLLDVPGAPAWLRRFRAVFVGGAPAWAELLERSRRLEIPLAPCYGMTETAAQVTTLTPAEFLGGGDGVGRALPHARVEIVDEHSHELLPAGSEGRIRIRGGSLFLGYHFEIERGRDAFLTADRGVLSADGELIVLGRLDAVINTGGEKVDPALVEAAIRATALVQDVAVFGAPDKDWGEIVVAAIVGGTTTDDVAIATQLRERLPTAARPKRWLRVTAIPRTAAGKVDRGALVALLKN